MLIVLHWSWICGLLHSVYQMVNPTCEINYHAGCLPTLELDLWSPHSVWEEFKSVKHKSWHLVKDQRSKRVVLIKGRALSAGIEALV